ncbi:MAG: hypothetical protein WCA35_03015 [Kovacikia sp.]
MSELVIKTGTNPGTMVDVDGRIVQANGRLKAGRVGVRVIRRGDTLSLRATLLAKPGAALRKDNRWAIALGVPANPAGVQLAERKARLLGAELQNGSFDWGKWGGHQTIDSPLSTVADWVKRFAREYQSTIEAVSWHKDYESVFAKLPQDEPLTADLLKRVLLQVKDVRPNSRTQRRYALAFERLARFAGLDVDLKHLRGSYSPTSSPDPRDIPSDELIAQIWQQITDPGWRWVCGMMATFGLRAHECFYLDTGELQAGGYMVAVKEGKTGHRLVWSFYPEWIDQFALRSPVLPEVKGTQHIHYTQKVSEFFSRSKAIPFSPLDLRHAWAIRTLECGLPYSEAAAQMGHSVTVHEKTYHRWITRETRQKIFDAVMWRGDRPRPPSA